MAAKAKKISVPVTIEPSGSSIATIALHQAIESFSYEERQALRDEALSKLVGDSEQPAGDNRPEVAADKAYVRMFEENTELIVGRAKAFKKFLDD